MTHLRVIKLGGSLLEIPNLAINLQEWLAQQTPAHQILLVGGGALVDDVRRWYSQDPRCEVPAHWLSIDLMTVTTRTFHESMPTTSLCEHFDRLLADRSTRETILFTPCRWLRDLEPQQPGTILPASWEVTSDSIAARLAVVLQAEELVLLKSAAPPCDSISEMAAHGYVDPMLPHLEHELPPVRFVNFRRGW